MAGSEAAIVLGAGALSVAGVAFALLAALCQSLGSLIAKPVMSTGVDPVAALLDFARSHRVSDLMVGRSRQPWWRRALGRSLRRTSSTPHSALRASPCIWTFLSNLG